MNFQLSAVIILPWLLCFASAQISRPEACAVKGVASEGLTAKFYPFPFQKFSLVRTPKFYGHDYAVPSPIHELKNIVDPNFVIGAECIPTDKSAPFICHNPTSHYCGSIECEPFQKNSPYWTTDIYGYNTTVSNITLELTGYLRAPETGVYNFHVDPADEAVYLYVGPGDAFNCCEQDSKPTVGATAALGLVFPKSGETQFYLVEGNYYPIKLVYFNANWIGQLLTSLTLPSGALSKDWGKYVYSYENSKKGVCSWNPSTPPGITTTSYTRGSITKASTIETRSTFTIGSNGGTTPVDIIVVETPISGNSPSSSIGVSSSGTPSSSIRLTSSTEGVSPTPISLSQSSLQISSSGTPSSSIRLTSSTEGVSPTPISLSQSSLQISSSGTPSSGIRLTSSTEGVSPTSVSLSQSSLQVSSSGTPSSSIRLTSSTEGVSPTSVSLSQSSLQISSSGTPSSGIRLTSSTEGVSPTSVSLSQSSLQVSSSGTPSSGIRLTSSTASVSPTSVSLSQSSLQVSSSGAPSSSIRLTSSTESVSPTLPGTTKTSYIRGSITKASTIATRSTLSVGTDGNTTPVNIVVVETPISDNTPLTETSYTRGSITKASTIATRSTVTVGIDGNTTPVNIVVVETPISDNTPSTGSVSPTGNTQIISTIPSHGYHNITTGEGSSTKTPNTGTAPPTTANTLKTTQKYTTLTSTVVVCDCSVKSSNGVYVPTHITFPVGSPPTNVVGQVLHNYNSLSLPSNPKSDVTGAANSVPTPPGADSFQWRNFVTSRCFYRCCSYLRRQRGYIWTLFLFGRCMHTSVIGIFLSLPLD
ncbi:uncharacterized protein KNAG_0I00100 [Huiozyma naganishii CBS 8797]|uniref:PA14 domain-containing protein n=1 Tax=Huiozyma naganishii (strain ATCC MYA-139 / BCRC 22969 / CBS 8797 / KCTC 17520 / NBRC 10181 / NCYC 3082 / Yp74L-3) TaxID=1071383 RepID=J7S231_HUIN7|nr:hypothetical protein KNAG_0I00100 [Kazachstania naganishii CBS 8797]CCK71802.1 hypothetical protein KNAG_0I00100 [Kazachstania naganishii CBS 8797]